MSCGHNHHSGDVSLRSISNAAQQILAGGMGGSNQQAEAQDTGYPKLNFQPKGALIEKIYQDRLRYLTAGGQYSKQNLSSQYIFDSVDSSPNVKITARLIPNLARPPFKEATSDLSKFKPISKGHKFGPSWSTTWCHVTISVPEKFKKYDTVEFRWDSSCESLVYSEDGDPLQGLTGGGERTVFSFPREWVDDGKEHSFWVEVAANGMFGNAPGGDSIQPPDPNRYFDLVKADIVAPNVEAYALYIDFWLLSDAAREFPTDSWEKHFALTTANEIVNTFEPGNQESILKCRKLAQKVIGNKVDSADVYKSDKEHLVWGIGHCHIDSCWLWPFAETKRKVVRSWVTQCNLIDKYPEYNFTASSAQQYKWLETLYPSAFERVKDHIKSGRFQYIGGSWVEHDTNMPSGESLTRQFILGQRYFESRFGKRCNTFWLPDTFGYSAQLPQLCRLAGMTRFMTQKLSWNNINKFPHTTFNWIALDGSQVLCHMPPAETYTAEAHFGDVKRSITQHKSLNDDNSSLLVFGKGDGGGGPTVEHIEKLRRARGISDTVGILPRVKLGHTVDDFFARIEKKASESNPFVTWYGELYFELHRGTYTTQSNNKKNNRQAEIFMRDIEFLATLASFQGNDYKYPKKDIDELWELICLCHFHDCLPGSSIEMVYRESDEYYKEVFERGEKLIEDASDALGFETKKKTEGRQELFAVNTSPWPRTEVVKVPEGTTLNAQWNSQQGKYVVLGLESKLGFGISVPIFAKGSEATSKAYKVSDNVYALENDNLKARIEGGLITSLYDKKAGREVIPKGKKGNQLVIFDDKPLYWQAWDVEVYHLETRKELSPGKITILEEGPLISSLLVETKISKTSWIKTTISLSAAVGPDAGTYLTFDSELEWRETMKFLKVEFPVDVYNTEASYETQYGITKRPTHFNTTWDMAKFEVCCHKFADLSEHNYGVSILNDCKYGFATQGNVMRLSLIRAPKAPDANADMGRHTFRYAIYPHRGGLSEQTVRAARDFGNPLKAAWTSKENLESVKAKLEMVTIEGDSNLMLDVVKRGEDDEDVSTGGLPTKEGRGVVLRVYDALGGKGKAKIHVRGKKVVRAWKTNLLEDEEEELKIEEGKVAIELRGFEVATYRLVLED